MNEVTLDNKPHISFYNDYHCPLVRNCVYMGKDMVDGKVYIGHTEQPLKERIKQHRKYAAKHNTSKLGKAIGLHGWRSIHWQIIHALDNQGIATYADIAQLQELERCYIQLYNSFRNGLNGSWGGERSTERY